MPWYSSVHRGSGAKSQVATAALEDARATVAAFAGARATDDVVLVRNTTEAINVLAAALAPGSRVVSTPVEHHANMLPWRRHDVRLLPFTASADALCAEAERALAGGDVDLLAVTGASNVTGEVWPLARLAAIAHRHGARLFADAAQLAAHRPLDMAAAGIDFAASRGASFYAPFGAGALIGDLRSLPGRAPLLRGGGAVELVTEGDVLWAGTPERHEAGSRTSSAPSHSPPAAGSCWASAWTPSPARGGAGGPPAARPGHGAGEARARALAGDGVERVGHATFELAHVRHPLLAAILSAEHAIGTRHGCFCAHPLIARLLGLGEAEVGRLGADLRAGRRPPLPGRGARESLGLGTTPEDVDRLVGALHAIAADGPAARYGYVAELDEYRPEAVPAA